MPRLIRKGINKGAIRITLGKGSKKTTTTEGLHYGGVRNRELSAQTLTSIFKAKVDEEIDFRMMFLADTLIHNLQADTPVDTGIARANWQIGVYRSKRSQGHTTRIIYQEYFEKSGRRHGLKRGVRLPLPAPYLIGLTRTEKFSVANGDKGLILTNNLPYIRKLNNGSSTQAPASFVDNAVFSAIEETKLL